MMTDTNRSLKYIDADIVFQEVPNEISLAISISGCPHHCKGCHSEYLWKYEGNYISDDLDKLIARHKDYITCVCFLGGDQNIEELNQLLYKVKQYGLKSCVYSGLNSIDGFCLDNIDYLKIGEFREEFGGLNNEKTNQKFFKITNGALTNCTYLFRETQVERG